MARFKLFIEYEGTRYHGWQVQKNARTVQGEMLDAAEHVFKTNGIEFYGAGRTDAGVHALEQVAHLDVETVLGPEIIRMKLNDKLPSDINILEVEKAAKTFHARHDAVGRSYIYQIARRRTAIGKRFVWWIKEDLKIDDMKEAATLFSGSNDFASFTEDDPEEKSTKVILHEIEIREAGDLIILRFTGSHFLWKLVRRLVGTIAAVGRGKASLDDVRGWLKRPSPDPARLTAPPSGLFLEKVSYSTKERPGPLHPVIWVSSGGRRLT